MAEIIETEFTDDEKLLLIFQKYKIEYQLAADSGSEDLEYEHRYSQAFLGLDDLTDSILRELAREAQGPGKRAYEAEQELLELSVQVKNLFPLTSHQIN